MSDLVTLGQLWQHGELARIEVDPSAPECKGLGVSGRKHAKSRTGSAARLRMPVLAVILSTARDGVIGDGRGSWDNLCYRQICRKLNICKRSAQRAVADLIAMGVLKVTYRHGQTNRWEVLHDRLRELIAQGKRAGIDFYNKVKDAAKTAYRATGLGPKDSPAPASSTQRASDELGELVDTFDTIFKAGSAQNAGFDRRTAKRLMRTRGVDAFGLVEDMRDIAAALEYSRAAEATTVLEKPHLLPRKKLWTRLVYLGREHRES